MPKVLIADAEKQTREFLKISLEAEHFTVFEATNGAMALMVAAGQKPDIMLLDVNLPVIDGFQVCQQLRQQTSLPIIIVSANANTEDRIRGLELGADDYIPKPFNMREVIARMTAVLRRVAEQPEKEQFQELHYVDLDINMDAEIVVAFGRTLSLTAKELRLLWCLASHPREVFSRLELLQKIWGNKCYSNPRTVDTHIKKLRQKLNVPDYSRWEIITVWGSGYKFQIKDEI